MSVTIRPAAESDLPALAALESACFAHPWSEKVWLKRSATAARCSF